MPKHSEFQVKKKKKLKKLFDNLIIAVFIITITLVIGAVSSVIILYANGQIPSTQGFVQTGNIRILSNVNLNSVEVNGVSTGLTNRLVTSLEPDSYKITVKQSGFLEWQKQVTVRPGLVSDVLVKLIPETLAYNQLIEEDIVSYTYSENAEYLFYAVENQTRANEFNLFRLRLTDSTPLNFFSEANINLGSFNLNQFGISSYKELYLSPSVDNRQLVIATREVAADSSAAVPGLTEVKADNDNMANFRIDYTRAVLVSGDTLNSRSNQVLLSTYVNFPFQELRWLGNSRDILLTSQDITVQFNIDSRSSQLVTYNNPNEKVFATGEELYIYKLESDTPVISRFVNGRRENVTTTAKLPVAKEIYSTKTNGTFLLLDNKNSVHYFNLRNNLSASLANVTKVSEVALDGRSVILEDLTGLKIVNFSDLIAISKVGIESRDLDATSSHRYTKSGRNTIIVRQDGISSICDREAGNCFPVGNNQLQPEKNTIEINSNESRVILAVKLKPEDLRTGLATSGEISEAQSEPVDDLDMTPIEQNNYRFYFISLT